MPSAYPRLSIVQRMRAVATTRQGQRSDKTDRKRRVLLWPDHRKLQPTRKRDEKEAEYYKTDKKIIQMRKRFERVLSMIDLTQLPLKDNVTRGIS